VAAQARIALRAAVDRAVALGAHEQAVSHIERALTITSDDAERAELLERAAASSFAGLVGDTADYARRALAAREAVGDVAGTHRATALVAQTLLDLNRIEDATEILTATLAKEENFPDIETEVDLYVALSRAHMRSGRPDASIAAAEHALTLAEPHNLVRAVADALNNRAASLNQLGRRREAVALLEAAVRLADEGGWQSLGMRMRNNLAVSVQDDDPVRAAEISREMLEITERIGHVQWYLQAATQVASNLYADMSDWDRALVLVDDAAARDVVGSMSWIQARTMAFTIRAARGEDIASHVAEIEATGLRGLGRWWTDAAVGDASLFTGDFEIAIERARACVLSPFAESNEGYVRAQLALALIALRRIDEAATVVAEMRDSVFQGAMSQAWLQAGQASLQAVEGRTGEARAAFTQAFDEMRRFRQLQDLVRWELEAISLLPDAPETTAWAAEVTDVGERVGAFALVQRLADVRPGSTARGSSTAERSEEPVPGPS
jgi:tetratricopeptide (TPR) repeat protein